ncbi:MAG TPA: hypothetical protein VMF10_16820 [Candidatus Aquilonibacter sp.]|nr:hypothetical protein [Candidatus Aquilonibacter sp.]
MANLSGSGVSLDADRLDRFDDFVISGKLLAPHLRDSRSLWRNSSSAREALSVRVW